MKKGQGSTPDFARCQEKFVRKWERTEGKGAGLCPSEGDRDAMDARITLDTAEIATLLAGDTACLWGRKR